MVLLRHLLGDVLRRLRLRQGRTLREVSAAARVSLGYLSEVERGQKEASSELLTAICDALGTPLSQVFREVSDNFALAELQNEPVLTGGREPVLTDRREPVLTGAREPALDTQERVPDTPAATAFQGPVRPQLETVPARKIAATGKPTLGTVQFRPGHPAFDEVARGIQDLTDMVPV